MRGCWELTCGLVTAYVLGAAGALAQEATLDQRGMLTVEYGGLGIVQGDSLLLMDRDWHSIDQVTRLTPSVTRDGDATVATFASDHLHDLL